MIRTHHSIMHLRQIITILNFQMKSISEIFLPSFVFCAIFISCLGLFGLASYIAEQRTKEIAVRKVLGASVVNLWKLLSSEFVMLVFISCLIATPLAWYALHLWLQRYDIRTPISIWVFIIVSAATLMHCTSLPSATRS